MSSHPLQMQRLGSALLLLALLLCPLNSLAQNICFDDETASRLVVKLERCKIAEQQLVVQAGEDAELQQQLEILQGTIKLYEDQIGIYKTMMETTKALQDVKDQACKEQIKAATPTFWDNAQKYFVGIGIGGILVGIAFLI